MTVKLISNCIPNAMTSRHACLVLPSPFRKVRTSFRVKKASVSFFAGRCGFRRLLLLLNHFLTKPRRGAENSTFSKKRFNKETTSHITAALSVRKPCLNTCCGVDGLAQFHSSGNDCSTKTDITNPTESQHDSTMKPEKDSAANDQCASTGSSHQCSTCPGIWM